MPPPQQNKRVADGGRQAPIPRHHGRNIVQPFGLAVVAAVGVIALHAAYRNWTRQPEQFRNRQAANWDDEHQTMVNSGMVRHAAGSVGFNALLNAQTPIIWVLDTNDNLFVMSGILGDPKHSMAAMGGDVRSGGTGEWEPDANDVPRFTIFNVTGHYHASFESLNRAARAFRNAGFPPKIGQHSLGSGPRGYMWSVGQTLGFN